MKKKNNKNTIPAYAFGIDGINTISAGIGSVGAAIEGATDETSKGSVGGAALGGLAKGAALGASLGSVIPGIGTAIGGAVGAVGGAITGLFKGGARRRAALERLRRKQTLNKTKLGIDTAAATEGEYWDDNTLAYTFENGGILPDLAYLDNNEIVRDTSGNIVQVPNTKPGTDNHLVDASTLESVLSDKIKRPGTKHTFAKEGQILSKMTKPSKGKDIFAENTNRLNKINANKAYEKLLAEQEAVKAAKGVKPKLKGIPAYEDGKGKIVRWGDVKHRYNLSFDMPDNSVLRMLDDGTLEDTNGLYIGSPKKVKVGEGTFIPSVDPTPLSAPAGAVPANATKTKLSKPIDPVQLLADRREYWRNNDLYYADQLPEVSVTAKAPDTPKYMSYIQQWDPYWSNVLGVASDRVKSKEVQLNQNKHLIQAYGSAPAFYNATPKGGIDAVTYANNEPVYINNPNTPTKPTTTTTAVNTTVNATVPTTKTPNTPTKTTTTPTYNFVDPPMVNVEEPLIPFNDAYTQPLEIKNPTVAKPDLSPISKKIGNKKGPKDKIPTNSYTPDWLSLAPTVYNALQSLRGPENEPLVLNPYADAIRSTMARRRMNIEPARLANSRTRAISNYNLANINANTGANLAARTQAAVGELASNADMYATKQNADNAYLGEYANVLNNLGQQFVQSQNMYNDLNARNRAAARNFGANAASQLGKWSQVRRQEQNQYNRDQLITPFLADFLNQGYTKDQVNYLLARTRNKF